MTGSSKISQALGSPLIVSIVAIGDPPSPTGRTSLFFAVRSRIDSLVV
jgi:hypothetical protein